ASTLPRRAPWTASHRPGQEEIIFIPRHPDFGPNHCDGGASPFTVPLGATAPAPCGNRDPAHLPPRAVSRGGACPEFLARRLQRGGLPRAQVLRRARVDHDP